MTRIQRRKGCFRAGTLAALFVLWAAFGFIVGQAFNFYWLAEYEDSLFDAIVFKENGQAQTDDEYALLIAERVHNLVTPGLKVFAGQAGSVQPNALFRSPAFDLLDARGGCGSFSAVLARAFLKAGFPVRIGQMVCVRASGELVKGCHMVVEAQIAGRWAVFDAMYDLHFRTLDGQLAGIDEVAKDWPYYKEQVGADYPANWFTYHAVRYTNWEKIPYVMPAAKEALRRLWLGDQIDEISVRVYVLHRFWLNFLAMAVAALGLLGGLLYLHSRLWRSADEPSAGSQQ